MVTVKNVHLRVGQRGTFVSLELQGDVELIQSLNTGRFYATVRRCFINSTMDEATAKGLIGKQFKGRISRVEADPYDFTVPETGEVIQLAHRWDYLPEEAVSLIPEKVSQSELV